MWESDSAQAISSILRLFGALSSQAWSFKSQIQDQRRGPILFPNAIGFLPAETSVADKHKHAPSSSLPPGPTAGMPMKNLT